MIFIITGGYQKCHGGVESRLHSHISRTRMRLLTWDFFSEGSILDYLLNFIFGFTNYLVCLCCVFKDLNY